jgi:hypothetical protein
MKFLSAEDFLNMQKPQKMVVLFTSKTCEFCVQTKEQVEKFIEPDFIGTLDFFIVDTNDIISKTYGITVLPALGIFKNNIEYSSKIGLFEENEYESFKNSISFLLGV